MAAGGFATYVLFKEYGVINFSFSGNPAQMQQVSTSSTSPVNVTSTLDRSPDIAAFVGPKQLTDERIDVDLKTQTLTYYDGAELMGSFKISSGIPQLATPPGTYAIMEKIPVHDFKGTNLDGTTYDFPGTKYNLLFYSGGGGDNLYVHGAPWNHHLGTQQSHGCINASYADMETLYPWAVVGAIVTIQ